MTKKEWYKISMQMLFPKPPREEFIDELMARRSDPNRKEVKHGKHKNSINGAGRPNS